MSPWMGIMDASVLVVIVITSSIIISLTITCSPFVAGEIRHTGIRADDRAAIPLNLFFFTRGGQLELNVTHLSFLPVPDHASLSKIGFVLLPTTSWSNLSSQIPGGNATCAFEYPCADKVLTLDEAEWNLLHPSPANYCEYALVFANCLSQKVKVSMNVRSAMYNRVENKPTPTMSYLMVGPIIPILYFLFTLIYLVLVVVWINVMLANRLHVSSLHYAMLAALLLKALSLFCEAMQKWHVDQTGSTTWWWWDAWFYTSNLFSSISFHIVTLVIGYTQWQLSSTPQLRARDRRILMGSALLQLVANAARVANDKFSRRRPHGSGDNLWLSVFVVFNFASLWPLLLSFRSAVEKLMMIGTHRKATDVLKKEQLICHYFIVTAIYVLFGPTLECLLHVFATSYDYCWIIVLALELVTLTFYAFTGYLFAPCFFHYYYITGHVP